MRVRLGARARASARPRVEVRARVRGLGLRWPVSRSSSVFAHTPPSAAYDQRHEYLVRGRGRGRGWAGVGVLG